MAASQPQNPMPGIQRKKYHYKRSLHDMCTGWWFQPLWRILVSWGCCSQYMENIKTFQTTNQCIYIYMYMQISLTIWLDHLHASSFSVKSQRPQLNPPLGPCRLRAMAFWFVRTAAQRLCSKHLWWTHRRQGGETAPTTMIQWYDGWI